MSTEQKQQSQQAELQKQLWSIANDLRGNMDANEFKNYILGLIFYRYLSENLINYVNKHMLKGEMSYEDAWKKEEYKEGLIEDLIESSDIGYYIEPKYLWSSLIYDIKSGKFDITELSKAISSITASTEGEESEEDFKNLFDDMDLTSTRLGKGEADRTKLISKIMLKINDIDFSHNDAEIDVLGDAYEYLISKFAADAGKKAGEFYTPQQVSKILAKLVTINKTNIKTVYDPTCGSGSLLLQVGNEAKVSMYYGQESISTTYNLARMNMLLHGVSFKHFDIKNDDTLERPQHLDKIPFDVIVANPPYSANWSADQKFLDDDRFSMYGALAPKSKADYAFICHMLYSLSDSGTMAVVLPHGVLFRGAAEGKIRKYIIENKNWLDAVIGLPANIFYGTSIPTCILVFKKCRENENNVLFIDASKDFEPGKNQNRLRDEDINKIMETYKNREEKEKYSHVATLEEIKENDYNLNIPRYVDTFEEEEEIDIKAVQQELKEIDKQIEEVDKELNVYLKELGLDEI